MDGSGMAGPALGLTARRGGGRIERRVAVLIALQLAGGLAFTLLAGAKGAPVGPPVAIVLLTGAFALAGSFDMPLEFRRFNITFTLAEAVLAAGFFFVGPLGLAIAAAVGETIDMAAQRLAPIKAAFNVTNRFAAATVAGVAFAALGRGDVHDASAWSAALAGALCFSIIDVVSTSAVLSIVERAPFHDMFVRSVSTGMLATLAAAPIGLITLDLAAHGPFTPLILVPLALAVALNSKYAVTQRDEHLRFERLYTSLARSAGLVAFDEALAAIAGEARSLATGSTALCCATNVELGWTGAVSDDTGNRVATPDAVAVALALAARAPGTEIDLADAPELAALASDAKSAVVVSSVHETAGRVVLIVVRNGPASQTASSRIETLSAFAHQAALVVSNAKLHEERAVALAREIDLNRQKGDFVAAVSHELRTPLGVMLGSVHTLERLDGRITEAQREQLFDMTITQGARLQRLIDELLLVAAAEHSTVPLEREVVEPAELLDSITATVDPSVRDRVQCRVAGADELTTDRSKLERILVNLVDNATKYAPDGPIELHAASAGDEIRFAVVDHGPGIPADDRERVFERFVQLDQSSTRRQGGTGLGLHLCRQLAARIDGELRLGPTPGGGCTFTLTVPVTPVAAECEQSEPSESAESAETGAAGASAHCAGARPAVLARPRALPIA